MEESNSRSKEMPDVSDKRVNNEAPACASVCPTAITFGDRDELLAEAKRESKKMAI